MAQLPINTFLRERLAEYDPNFELRPGTAFSELFFKPVSFIVQPLRTEADDLRIAQSFKRILEQEDPDSFDEEAVDSLAANIFVDRITGGRSTGVVRVYYDTPVAREYPATGATFVGNNGHNYLNPSTFAISQAEMSSQIDGGLYYYDIPVQSENTGKDTELDAGGIVSLLNDEDVISVTNLLRIQGGISRESNTQLINRTKNSIAVRDLVTGKGFNAILFENFAGQITELQPIGFGDPEMMRDIIFNTHIGGKIDGYFKAPTIQTKVMNFVGLLIDTTRQAGTATNITLSGLVATDLGNPNIDRSNGRAPIVKQIKAEDSAMVVGTIDLTSPISLLAGAAIKLTINGVVRNITVAGAVPSATTRFEIQNAINTAFSDELGGATIATFAVSGGQIFLRLRSPGVGKTETLTVDEPDSGSPAAHLILDPSLTGGGVPATYSGDGPYIFSESVHYTVDDPNGMIARLPLVNKGSAGTDGETFEDSDEFESGASPFGTAAVDDILTITSGPDAGEYRVVEVISSSKLRLDKELTANNSGLSFQLKQPGIKDGELVSVRYYYNPLSIDIGNLVKLDPEGKTRGIRPGRESRTIPDTAFLRIKRIELIDPITAEPLGIFLSGVGGYGMGGYGEGGYGVGGGSEYRLIVNSPHERYSAFEDSYIVLNSGFQGLSVQVEYEYVPEVTSLHNFVRSPNERVLDGDILMKHFVPAYVSGTIRYSVDVNDLSIPDNDELTELVRAWIDSIPHGQSLQYSDLKQYIYSVTDPFRRYGTFIRDFEFRADIYNVDGTVVSIKTKDQLEFPAPDLPRDTTRPLSPRMCHWIAGEIELIRE